MAFALARDGNFFRALAQVHPRFRTPHVAILVEAALSTAFLVLGGNFRQLFTLALFAEWLSYATASSAVFVFRRKLPPSTHRQRIWGYPLAPAVFILASCALLYYTFLGNLHYSALGTLVILAGIPVYYAFHRKS
jgi:APA family basic amino acid/polyamine antiporter